MKLARDPSLSRESRPQPGDRLLAGRIIRHGIWAGTIAGRFKQKSGRQGWSPASLIHHQPAGALFVSLRKARCFSTTQRIAGPAHPLVNNFFTEKTVLFRSPAAASKELAANSLRVLPAPRMFARSRVERTVERQLWRYDSPPPRVAVQHPSAQVASNRNAIPTLVDALEIRRQILTQETAVQHARSTEIALAFVQRLRRVEQRPAPAPALSESLPKTAGMSAASDFVLESPRGAPAKGIRAASVLDAMPAPPSSAGFNVTQLTDEVMRQLDRRVIAARERLGKI